MEVEFKIGQRVYYHFHPSGGERRWYGYVIEINRVHHVYNTEETVEYTIQFDGIHNPQRYSNTPEGRMIFSDEPQEPSWEV